MLKHSLAFFKFSEENSIRSRQVQSSIHKGLSITKVQKTLLWGKYESYGNKSISFCFKFANMCWNKVLATLTIYIYSLSNFCELNSIKFSELKYHKIFHQSQETPLWDKFFSNCNKAIAKGFHFPNVLKQNLSELL